MYDQTSMCQRMKLESFSHTYILLLKVEVQPLVVLAVFTFCSVAVAGQG